MFQTFDFRCVQTLATTAPCYRGGVYVINVTYSRKRRSVAAPFSIMLYIVNNLPGCLLSLQSFVKGESFWKAQSKPRIRKIIDFFIFFPQLEFPMFQTVEVHPPPRVAER